jgi:hypothetical protein
MKLPIVAAAIVLGLVVLGSPKPYPQFEQWSRPL